MNILIVKTSSLGDIIQAFDVLDDLRARFPSASIDWAVEEAFYPVVAAHPLVRNAIPLDIKGLKRPASYRWKQLFRSIRGLRREKYDLIFDLQGNCKSGVVTFLARGIVKVGFGIHSVREWPNLFATQVRFEVSKKMNIRLQHLDLVKQFFKTEPPVQEQGVRFKIEESDKRKISSLLASPSLNRNFKIMVCPGSKWMNKQLPLKTLVEFLEKIERSCSASFLLVWGGEAERAFCEEIHASFPMSSLVIDRLPIPVWQNLMSEVGLVLAVDSSALHLCGTTSTPSFSLFGPSSPSVFKPIGPRHFAFQGKCPYGRTFDKTCPVLRTCPTGACIRELDTEQIFRAFSDWWFKKKPYPKF